MLLLELFGTLIPERLMRPPFVVPGDPGTDHSRRLGKTLEGVLPHTLLFQAAKKTLNQTILFGCVRRNVLLVEPIEGAGIAESSALEDEAIVTPNDGRVPARANGSEALQTGCFQRPFRFLRAAPQRKLKADQFAIVTINDGREVGPAVTPNRDMRHIHRPPLIAPLRHTAPPFDPRLGCHLPLTHQPALAPHQAVDPFPVDHQLVPKA